MGYNARNAPRMYTWTDEPFSLTAFYDLEPDPEDDEFEFNLSSAIDNDIYMDEHLNMDENDIYIQEEEEELNYYISLVKNRELFDKLRALQYEYKAKLYKKRALQEECKEKLRDKKRARLQEEYKEKLYKLVYDH